MKQKFIVRDSFWELFPETEIAVLLADDVSNRSYENMPKDLLKQANSRAIKWVEEDPISANPVIKDWRTAYQRFKTKKGARCAVENLLKRAKQQNGVKSINPVVDIYNSVSLEWAFPVAGEDRDFLKGDLELTIAQGGEIFVPISEERTEEALTGEVVYKDSESIISRCWAWRDSARVQVTEDTTNLVFYMENINPERKAEHKQAIQLLQSRLKQYLSIETTFGLITKQQPEITL
ncbi:MULTISPECIES: B3/4 domain-containing protein [Tetragenococcus]|uniref:B3/4 domain-containing protein n=1 Tax=Tetragenococcus muriaticus 3MR10-3 TaxID=1302648 RepID=A0A091BWT8_9ENTE|nr:MULTISPECIES: phenylalanine--tRNA ligase beta subunit-related protein [Tetragenococcus]KFN89209.1 B3/4 domain-containing protein [Tetragenococcus muriaticus 3MR10-3]MCF1602418.1 tRNA ligase [Tetragenococcus halophilus]MDN6166994.1 tRNA ligase [Tetragenococcus koreensis]